MLSIIAIMFQTITKLYEMLSTPSGTTADLGKYSYFGGTTSNKSNYIYYGASVINCDDNKVCSVYYPVDNIVLPNTSPANTTRITSVSG